MAAFRAILLVAAMVIPPLSVAAIPTNVDVDPPSPGIADSISLSTQLQWPTTGYSVTSSTTTFPSVFEVNVDVFVSSPAPGENVLFVITGAMRDTELGVLPPGTYSYTVSEIQTQRGTGFQSLAGSISGSFTVVPEPSPTFLLALGLAVMAMRRGRSHRNSGALPPNPRS